MIWILRKARNSISTIKKRTNDIDIKKGCTAVCNFQRYMPEKIYSHSFKINPQNHSFPPPSILALFSSPLTHYIGLKARISQVALNKYSIFIYILIVKVLLFFKSISSSLSLAEVYTSQACQLALSEANQLSTLPQTLGIQANKFIAKGMETIVDRLVDTLILLITIVQNLVIFFVNFMTSTYTCLIMSVVEGTISAALNATETIIEYTNKTMITLTDSLQNGFNDVSHLLNSATGTLNEISSFFTGEETSLKQINLTIGELQNFTIPSGINDKLESLKDNIPTFESVQNKTDEVLSIPFNLVKSKIMQKLGNNGTGYQFDSSQLTTPTTDSLSTNNMDNYCLIDQDRHNIIPQNFNNLEKGIHLALNILLIVLVLIAIGFIGLMTWDEIRKWKWMKNKSNEFFYSSTPTFNLNQNSTQDFNLNYKGIKNSKQEALTLIDNVQRPYSYRIGSYLTAKKPPLCRIHTQWFINFIAFPHSMNLFLLSIIGLFSVLLQYILLSKISKVSPDFTTPAAQLAQYLSSALSEQVSSWTENTNLVINNTETTINTDLLGWIETATLAVNNTVSEFMDEITTTLKSGFEGTPLYTPIENAVYCLIGMKLKNIEKGLTWINQKATIKFPRVSNNTLVDGIYSGLLTNSSGSESINYTTSSNSSVKYFNNKKNVSINSTTVIPSELSSYKLQKIADKIWDKTSGLLSSTLEATVSSFMESLKVEFYISLTLFLLWFFGIFLTSGIYTLFCYTKYDNADYNPAGDELSTSGEKSFSRITTKALSPSFQNSPATTLVSTNVSELPFEKQLPPPPPASRKVWRSPNGTREQTHTYPHAIRGFKGNNIPESPSPTSDIKCPETAPSFSTWNFSSHFEPPAVFLDSPLNTDDTFSPYHGAEASPSISTPSLMLPSTENLPFFSDSRLPTNFGGTSINKTENTSANTAHTNNNQNAIPIVKPLKHHNVLEKNMIIEQAQTRKSTCINSRFSYT